MPLFAFLSLLLHVTAYCQSLSLAAVDSAVIVRIGYHFSPLVSPLALPLLLQNFVFVAGPRIPVLFWSDKVWPVTAVLMVVGHIFRFERQERRYSNAFFGGWGMCWTLFLDIWYLKHVTVPTYLRTIHLNTLHYGGTSSCLPQIWTHSHKKVLGPAG